MTPPKDRDAVIEVMAENMGANNLVFRRLAESAICALESSGCFVGPTFPTVNMAAAGETWCDVGAASTWQAMVSANPYGKDPSQ